MEMGPFKLGSNKAKRYVKCFYCKAHMNVLCYLFSMLKIYF